MDECSAGEIGQEMQNALSCKKREESNKCLASTMVALYSAPLLPAALARVAELVYAQD